MNISTNFAWTKNYYYLDENNHLTTMSLSWFARVARFFGAFAETRLSNVGEEAFRSLVTREISQQECDDCTKIAKKALNLGKLPEYIRLGTSDVGGKKIIYEIKPKFSQDYDDKGYIDFRLRLGNTAEKVDVVFGKNKITGFTFSPIEGREIDKDLIAPTMLAVHKIVKDSDMGALSWPNLEARAWHQTVYLNDKGGAERFIAEYNFKREVGNTFQPYKLESKDILDSPYSIKNGDKEISISLKNLFEEIVELKPNFFEVLSCPRL